MRPSVPSLKSTSSSTRWLARQRSDPFVRARMSETFRSRSSFKLVSLANKHAYLLRPGSVVVDLGAAPGGWSQVAAAKVRARGNVKGRVVALDIEEMDPLDGVEVLRGDFLKEATKVNLRNLLLLGAGGRSVHVDAKGGGEEGGGGGGMVDTVLSDMMAPMSGHRIRDIQASLDLVEAATGFAKGVLKVGKKPVGDAEAEEPKVDKRGRRVYRGGNLVLKFFMHPDLDDFRRTELDPYFGKVHIEKPQESRKESSEAYWVCQGFKGLGR